MSNSTPDGAEPIDVVGPRDAQAVVFVHGAAFTRTMWAPQRDALKDEHRVIAFDLPGHGDRADEEFRLDRAVSLLGEAIDREAGGNALVVGLSLGGYVATAYAHRRPETVDGLVISGSSANPTDSLEPLTRGIAGATRLLTRSDRIGGAADRFAKRWVKNRNLPPETEREIIESGFYLRQFGVAGPQLAGKDFRSAFGSYPGPALIANGQKDLVNRRGEDRHAAAAENARVEVIDGAGHTCNLHRPAAYTDAVRRFHRQRVASPAGID